MAPPVYHVGQRVLHSCLLDSGASARYKAVVDEVTASGRSDRLLALGCAELYTRKRQRGEGQDLELAREGLLALARHKRARAGQ